MKQTKDEALTDLRNRIRLAERHKHSDEPRDAEAWYKGFVEGLYRALDVMKTIEA